MYVMLPLDSVWLREVNGRIVSMVKRERALEVGLKTLKKAGVKGACSWISSRAWAPC